MAKSQSFADHMARLKTGDEEAAASIFNRFATRLVGLTRKRVAEHLRRKEDPEDIVQSVFRSFLTREAAGQFDLKSWPELWSLLVVMTIRKCNCRFDYFFAARRDIRREQARPLRADDSASGMEALARDPLPSEVAAFNDLLQKIMISLQERGRQVLTLSLQGYAVPEIKSQLDCSERTIFRILNQVKKRLHRWQMSEIDG